MDNIYVFGHKKPDTDSVTSAISLANLKRQQGIDAEPRVLGELSKETKFVLDYFKVEEPSLLEDVKLQIKDLDYHRGLLLNHKASIKKAYNYMESESITGVPIVDDDNKFVSLVTLKGIVKNLISGNIHELNTSYDNILDTLDGEEVLRFDTEIVGNLKVASYRSTTFLENINLCNDDILIVGDRHSIIEYAVNSSVKLLIVVGNGEIKEQHLNKARENHVNIIRTSLATFDAVKLINLSNYIETLIEDGRIITFYEDDYYDDFMIKSSKLRHNNYPIIDMDNKCLGLLRVTDINEKNRKKVILVDHNEEEQSVDGLNEAEIIEIVDHHKLGNISTNNPINFRNMSVGSTNTILYDMYKEQKESIPDSIMGLMLSGILSDTLCLTSPTTTKYDIKAVNDLAKKLNIDYQEYSRSMFKAGTSLEGKTKEEIITGDMKSFPFDDKRFAVSQVFTLNFLDIYEEKDEYIRIIEEMCRERDYSMIVMAVTDILKNGSYIFYTENAKRVLEDAYGIEDFEQGTYVDGVVSRKKQIVPSLLENMR